MKKSCCSENIKEIKCHSRVFLSGISTALKRQGGDPRLQASGMTANGFTLIELLVVVLIIGILAAIALPQYQKAVWRARFQQYRVLGDTVAKAEEIYYLTHGEYTREIGDLDIAITPGENCEFKNPSGWVYSRLRCEKEGIDIKVLDYGWVSAGMMSDDFYYTRPLMHPSNPSFVPSGPSCTVNPNNQKHAFYESICQAFGNGEVKERTNQTFYILAL